MPKYISPKYISTYAVNAVFRLGTKSIVRQLNFSQSMDCSCARVLAVLIIYPEVVDMSIN